MTRFRISLSIGAAVFGLLLAAAPAKAQNLLTYVSAFTGSNSDSCSTPELACFDIDGALDKTHPGGEIRCLDIHPDGNIDIEKPVTIDCEAPVNWISGFSGVSAITINLNEATYPNGVVTLRNLKINGLLGNGIIAPGADGIRVIGGGAAVHIENVTITGFAEQGIDFRPTSSVDLFIRNTTMSNNSGGGVWVVPAASAEVRGSLSDVRLDGNGGVGIAITKASGAAVAITVEDTQIEKNSVGLRSNGASAFILLAGSTIAHNTTGLQLLGGGKIVSSGNNTINFNATNGAPTSTVALK
jgi:hypothetical protein